MSYNILIVDDSATTRAMIARTIKLAELPIANIFEAGDGKAALDLLECISVDLVLADLNMPVMGGVEMTHRMRSQESTRDIPVVVISAEPNIDRLTQLADDGIQGYIRKPFTPENVRNVITHVIGGVHA